MRARRLLVGLVGVSGLVACARPSIKELGGARYRIDDIEIEGNEALDDAEILEHLNLGETTWFPLPDKRYYFEGFVPVDIERIEELYRAHGYYDAKVVRFEPRFHPRKDVVDLVFHVEEGPPTLVTEIRHHWPAGWPRSPDGVVRPEEIEPEDGLKVGAPYDLEEMTASEATMRAALQKRGFAFADVASVAQVDRDARRAEVDFYIVPGPFVRIKDVEFVGLHDVPEKLVRAEVEGFIGRPWSPTRIRRLEEAVHATGAFSSVTSSIGDPDGDEVTVTVRVMEARPQSVRLGVGLGLEVNRWEQYFAARYGHQNLFRNLTKLDLRVRAGYAEVPTLFRLEDHGPILLFEPRIAKKGLLEKHLVWTAEPAFELGVQEGYQFWSPRLRLGVSRFFTRFFQLGLAHAFHYYDFFNVSPTLDRSESVLSLDFRDPYTLSFVELEANLFLTDQLVDPNNGVVLLNRWAVAGGIFGGQFDYHKFIPDLRMYWTPLKNRLQLSARLTTGIIIPFGDEPGAPITERFYLGGSNSVRGFGLRRLSPFVVDCNRSGDCDRIPVGGESMVYGSFETRVRIWKDLWGAAFVDVGDVQRGKLVFRPDEWSYTAGPGLRYRSPIGILRVDVGIRINDQPRFAHERRWAFHIGLGEAF